jgi:hypothetical protein
MASPATNKETAVVRPLVSSLLARRNLFGFSCGQLRRDGYCLASRPRRLALICRVADLDWRLGRVYFLAFLNPSLRQPTPALTARMASPATVDEAMTELG